MPKLESESPMRRKSSRAKKLVNHSLLNDLPADVVTSMGEDKDVKMPPGFNPSDDSEDDYTPSVANRKGKRKDDSDIDSEEEVNDKVKKPRRTTPGRKPRRGSVVTPYNGGSSKKVELPVSNKPDISKIKAEKGLEDDLTCVVCKNVVKIDSNARFHYSVHYYEANPNPFLPILRPNDLRDGRAQDEAGKVFKYTCPYNGCTKRKMGYKEICVHLATAHQHLRRLLMEDKRPGMKEVLDKLYPPEEPNIPIAVKVKQEKGVISSISKRVEMDNSEDVDDPEEPELEGRPKPGTSAMKKVTPTLNAKSRVFPKSEVKMGGRSRASRGDKIHNCLICNAPGKNNKEGRNLNLGSGLQNLKFHYAACIYDEGGLLDLVDHAQGKGKKIGELEEYGTKYKYRCPFVDCAKNQGMGRNKATGYKEYAIHCAVLHHQIEKWMVADKREGIMEVYQTIVAAREEDNIELEEMPDEVEVEEMHTCIICQGEDKEGRNMSFLGQKLFSLRYHYAACFYDEGIYKDRYPPGPTNTTEKGDPIDELGHDVKYNCQERGCTVKRKMGYKEFAIHMSNEHGGLEEVIKVDARPEIRALVDKIKKPLQ